MSKTPVRVLIVQGVTILGGAHQSLVSLASGLKEKNVIPIVATSKEGAFTDLLNKNHIKYKIIPMGMWRKGKNFPTIPWALYKLQSCIREEKIDIVHANTMWDNPYAAFPARWSNLPLVCHIRSKVLPSMIRKYFLGRADRVISISKHLSKPISPFLSKPPIVIYNGIDRKYFSSTNHISIREKLGFSAKDRLVGIVGRIDPLKGQKLFVEAAGLVHRTHPNAKFVLVGGYGKKQEWFGKKISDTITSESFRSFCAYMGHEENIEQVFGALDIHVMPSLEEGLGRSNLEAMALKKPVISTRVGGIPECITDGENGFLIPYDSSVLAEKIRILLDSPELCRKMGENGFKRVQKQFTMDKYVDGVYSVYEELLQ